MLTVFELIHFFTVKVATTMTKIGLIVFVLLSACVLVFAAPAPWRIPMLYSHSLPSPSETAKNQWIAPAARFLGGVVGSTVGGRAINKFIDRHLCEKRDAELQHDTDNEDRIANIMALAQVMEEISAAKESLNALEKISMKDDRIAEVQFNAKINSIRDTLGNTGNYIKGAARNILCR